jgi:O-antigen ligase
LQFIIAFACLSAGIFLASNHPIWPQFACGILLLGVISCAVHPGTWLFLLPASLPFLNFSPWSGWHVFDEFDILILGSLAGGYGRLAMARGSDIRSAVVSNHQTESSTYSILQGLRALVLGVMVLSLMRGFESAGGFRWSWFGDYVDSTNGLRVFKSGLFSFLFLPLLRHNLARRRLQTQSWFASGLVTGLVGVVLVVLWERVAFPGLTEFSKSYRTAALFWEMHMGGGAIDAYFVLTAPFAMWALINTRRPLAWTGAAALLIGCVYAWLTTFSRGVYLAMAIALLFLWGGMLLSQQKHMQDRTTGAWRKRVNAILICGILFEVVAVFVGGGFMRERLSESERDWGGRIAHWHKGIALLDGPADWLFGIGLGRFPAQYSSRLPENEFSGSVRWVGPTQAQPKPLVRLSGPATRAELSGLFSLEQRLGRLSAESANVTLNLRASAPMEIQLALCEKHLLYVAECQRASVYVDEPAGRWHRLETNLIGPVLNGGHWYAPRFGQFSLTVITPGSTVDIADIQIGGVCASCNLQNANFSNELAHWSYSGRSYFVPWHIDNLYLELLIEQGISGLLLFLAMACSAMAGLMSPASRNQPFNCYLAASLVGLAALGMVVSVMDMPRVAFLLWTMLHFAHEAHLQDVTISRNG